METDVFMEHRKACTTICHNSILKFIALDKKAVIADYRRYRNAADNIKEVADIVAEDNKSLL